MERVGRKGEKELEEGRKLLPSANYEFVEADFTSTATDVNSLRREQPIR